MISTCQDERELKAYAEDQMLVRIDVAQLVMDRG